VEARFFRDLFLAACYVLKEVFFHFKLMH